MKPLVSFWVKHLIALALLLIIVTGSYYFVAFVYKPHLAALYPVQYFQDTESSGSTFLSNAQGLVKELTVSPHTTIYLRRVLAITTIAIIIFLIWHATRFLIIHRRRLTIWQRLAAIPISIVMLVVYLWVLVYVPKYTFAPWLKHLTETMIAQSAESDMVSAVQDPEDIIAMLHKDPRPVQIISGYGAYNGQVKKLTGNPRENNLSYYKLMFVPTAARALAEAEESKPVDSSRNPIVYYPESHQLVINSLSNQSSFLEALSIDLISKLPYPALNKALKQRGLPDEYRIVASSEYAKYYVRQLIDTDEKIIASDQAAYARNLAAIAECQKTQKDNQDIIDRQMAEYQAMCVSGSYYSDCSAYKDKIEENKRIANETSLSCDASRLNIGRFNDEITEEIRVIKDKIREVSTTGTLERNKAEFGAGVFMSPSSIYLKDDSLVVQIVSTSVHEFTHFAVYNTHRDLPAFIDEGMTDYLMWKALGYNKYFSVGISGYYAEMQIVFSLLEKIPFDEMLDMYIAGDSVRFKKSFVKYFPGVSYEDFIKKGGQIFNTTYATDSMGRTITFNVSGRDYIWLKDVEDIRTFLGLKPSLEYTTLESSF